MRVPDLPANEDFRVAALRALFILDTQAEERFERLTRTAVYVLDVPIALVSLIDSDRQWFKSQVGFAAQETARDISFCGHAILEQGSFIVEDARQDIRFADNPLVTGDPDIRFYAGVPLHDASGLVMGTLCAVDREPRRLSSTQEAMLRDIAAMAERELQIVRCWGVSATR